MIKTLRYGLPTNHVILTHTLIKNLKSLGCLSKCPQIIGHKKEFHPSRKESTVTTVNQAIVAKYDTTPVAWVSPSRSSQFPPP